MTTKLNAYLSFRDNAREALEFYQSVFGGELDISTFAEFHASEDPAESEKVMHGHLQTPGGLELMASDTPNSMEIHPGDNFALSLSGDTSDEEELRGYWDKLSDGGQVTMPLEKAPWGDYFGMCVDKFGIGWMVDFAAEKSEDEAGQEAGAQA